MKELQHNFISMYTIEEKTEILSNIDKQELSLESVNLVKEIIKTDESFKIQTLESLKAQMDRDKQTSINNLQLYCHILNDLIQQQNGISLENVKSGDNLEDLIYRKLIK